MVTLPRYLRLAAPIASLALLIACSSEPQPGASDVASGLASAPATVAPPAPPDDAQHIEFDAGVAQASVARALGLVEYKQEAVRLVQTGQSQASVARALGLVE